MHCWWYYQGTCFFVSVPTLESTLNCFSISEFLAYQGYGCPGLSITGSAVAVAEVARVDASCSTFILVHSSLAMLTIGKYLELPLCYHLSYSWNCRLVHFFFS